MVSTVRVVCMMCVSVNVAHLQEKYTNNLHTPPHTPHTPHTLHPPPVSKNCRYFAPGNMRATADNPEYQKLLQYWTDNKYTLRYSGGLVPGT